jgi:hypothetical protein
MRLRLARCTAVDRRAWTGLTDRQIHRLIEDLRRACPDAGRGRSWALGFPDRVLLVLAYRTNLTMQQLESLFGISDSAVHRVIDRLTPHLASLLGLPPTDRREPWIVNGTLIPAHDQKRTAKSKSYWRSVNAQIVCQARDRRIVAVSDAWPGNRNDTIVFRETVGKTLPGHSRLIGDGGDGDGDGGNPNVQSPRLCPDGRIIKDLNHRQFRKRRARVEHTISRLKDHHILRQCRRRGQAIDHTITGVATLHNPKLEIP